MSFPDNHFDTVVTTTVLCSVPDIDAVLREVIRVLKPGGRFLFLEHVVDKKSGFRRFVQKTAPFTPWRYCSDGCNPGLDIGASIERAGFAEVHFDTYPQEGSGIILWVIRPHIVGKAVKKDATTTNATTTKTTAKTTTKATAT